MVFTGDSDLLVHNLGLHGAVTFFKDIQGESGSLRSYIYNPTLIASKLNLPLHDDLRALAFSMKSDYHLTLPMHISRTSSGSVIDADEHGYTLFSLEYSTLPLAPSLPTNAFLQALQTLDPRISEYVLQYPTLAALAGHAGFSQTEEPHVFLPFLLDCPIRTNAWEPSTSVRQLAYGLLNLILPIPEQRFAVIEHRRQQTSSSGREWALPSLAQLAPACTALLQELHEVATKLPKAGIWLAIAVLQDVRWSNDAGKAVLSKTVLAQFPPRGADKAGRYNTWDMVHFLAQVQGSFYSFRVLKQVIGVVLAFDGTVMEIPAVVKELGKRLAGLPGFEEVESVVQSAEGLQEKELRACIVAAFGILGIDEQRPEGGKARRKRKRQKAKTVAKEKDGNGGNPFGLLGDE